jgi:hypothetical protein
LFERIDPNLPPLARYLHGYLHDNFYWDFDDNFYWDFDFNQLWLVQAVESIISFNAP